MPLRFEGVHRGIGERIQPLLRSFGGKATYLLSPEVLRDGRCVEMLAALPGCELGTHLHGEMAQPGALVPDVTRDVQRDYPRDLERAKLASLTASFHSGLGRPPSSFRAGRFGVGPHTVPILEELGYAVDSSVTPGIDWSEVSPGLSFVGAPHQPYHPDRGAPGRRGAARLLEVPVTTAPRRASRIPVVGRLAGPRWLRPTRASGRTLLRTAREAVRTNLRDRDGRPVVLNAMLHNVEVVPGASPYAATYGQANAILERLATLLSWARAEGIACIGLSDVADVLAEGAATSREPWIR